MQIRASAFEGDLGVHNGRAGAVSCAALTATGTVAGATLTSTGAVSSAGRPAWAC